MTKWKHLEPNPLFESAYRQMSLEKGFYREVNLDVEINHITTGGNAILGALNAGEADSGELGPAPVIVSGVKGVATKLLGAFMPGNIYYVYGPTSAKSLEDLKGKSVGTSAPGALLYELFTAILDQKKLDIRDYQIVNFGGSGPVFQALVAGAIDAGVSGIEFEKEALATGKIHPVVTVGDLLPDYVRLGVAASEKAMKEKAEALQWFAIAHMRGYRWAVDHKEDTLQLAGKITGKDPKANDWVFDWYAAHKVINPNAELSGGQLDYMQALYLKLGTITEKVPNDRIYEPKYVKTALEVLGPYRPGATR